MKILVYGLNYAPEMSGVGKYTAEMTELLAARGHDVRMVCAPPYYPQWRVQDGYRAWRYRRDEWHGVRVWRAPLWVPSRPGGLKRIVHLASFAAASLPLLIRHAAWRPQVVMLIAPTLLCAPGALAAARAAGAKTWLHIQDFEVDAAFDLGLLQGGRAARFARAMERLLLRRFDVVSSISAKMVERVVDKGVDAQRAVCVPNWVDTSAIYPLPAPSAYRERLGIPADNTVVLYSGNMGAKQGIEILADVATALAPRRDISFVFCGDGAAKRELAARCASLPNCHVLPLQPTASLNELLNVADIHVLPQRGDAADLVMPSKLTGMLASGRAVVAMARPGTSLFDVVSNHGVAVPPEDSGTLAATIVALAADPERRAALGRAARQYAQRMLSPHSIFGALDARLAALVQGGAMTPAVATAAVDAAAVGALAAGAHGVASDAAMGAAGPALPEIEQSDAQ
ncbi:glycosyltransferase WbuB [Paraburkholderia caballeronis]|uniref:glycosyltransferase WbuB n=1 Tax=Paraburkholderia caballeronis TaxID=416943 RepID=UPI0010656151|nr:glycosyltransferase WbuB [Paraburkholderia caballeronis]TDV18257.1 colanic acid biosynthesis glycosyl transferase WcaI [Paraburkholderia caballeronis]TDV20205.1 colanic acid biosynthesis glycosyl transferase WcaI [Paraburkholderia caballeronis]TDV28422.1 colanic acid biosynthesis glycosyl transferase WcaI [Paraburkholderia caballeronis]